MKRETFFDLLDFCRLHPGAGIPTLVGVSRTGKTWSYAQYAALRAKLPLVTSVPSLEESEELGGLPIRRGNRVVYSVPPAISTAYERAGIGLDQPCVFLIDELDKARQDVLAALLKLLSWERTLRSWTPPPGTLICAAMNLPEADLPEPLTQRLVFFPWPHVLDDWADTLPPIVRAVDRARLPKTEPAYPPRPIDCPQPLLAAWAEWPTFWADAEVRRWIVRGLYPSAHVPAVIQLIEAEFASKSFVDWAKTASPTEILHSFVRRWNNEPDVEKRAEATSIIADRALADETGEMGMVWEALSTAQKLAFLGMDDVDATEITDDLLATYEQIVKAQSQKAK